MLNAPRTSFDKIHLPLDLQRKVWNEHPKSSECESISVLKALPSAKGYLIRPFVELSGQRDEYQWILKNKGNWRSFLASKKKIFTLKNMGTGHFSFDLILEVLSHDTTFMSIYLFSRSEIKQQFGESNRKGLFRGTLLQSRHASGQIRYRWYFNSNR